MVIGDVGTASELTGAIHILVLNALKSSATSSLKMMTWLA